MFERTMRMMPMLMIFGLATTAHADVVTDHLVYNWDADGQTATQWSVSSPGSDTSHNWNMGGATSIVSPVTTTNITSGYSFAGGSAASYIDGLSGAASFELWVRPANFTGGKQVIFENGAKTNGMNISLWDDTVYLGIKEDAANADLPNVILSKQLSSGDAADFIQIVAVIDASGTRLYVNPVSSSSPQTAAATGGVANGAFIGNSTAGLAGTNNLLGAGGGPGWTGFGNFAGEIGLVRFYGDALSGAEVAQNFAAVVPEPATIVLLSTGAGLLMIRRRR